MEYDPIFANIATGMMIGAPIVILLMIRFIRKKIADAEVTNRRESDKRQPSKGSAVNSELLTIPGSYQSIEIS